VLEGGEEVGAFLVEGVEGEGGGGGGGGGGAGWGREWGMLLVG